MYFSFLLSQEYSGPKLMPQPSRHAGSHPLSERGPADRQDRERGPTSREGGRNASSERTFSSRNERSSSPVGNRRAEGTGSYRGTEGSGSYRNVEGSGGYREAEGSAAARGVRETDPRMLRILSATK